MFLRCRPVRLSDLHDCSACIRDHFAYDADTRASLVMMWRDLLSTRSATGRVIEDLDAEPHSRIAWFALHVFPDDAWSLSLKGGDRPFPGLQLLECWQQGELPILTAPQIRAANSRGPGLTLLALHSGSAPILMAGYNSSMLTNYISGSHYYAAGGYRLKEVLIEGYGAWQWAWIENFGGCLRSEYAAHYTHVGVPGDNRRARLYGINAAEAAAQVGGAGAQMFVYAPPRFAFSAVQQELLLAALAFETDVEISEHLGVALITTRKRWATIYERVQSVSPALTRETTAPEARRGVEKKRRLLSYLRNHMEELRPHDLPPEDASPPQ